MTDVEQIARYVEYLKHKNDPIYDPTKPYYHGGVPNLKPGDFILPPNITGQVTYSDIANELASRGYKYFQNLDYPKCRRDRVYVSDSVVRAKEYARIWSSLPMPGLGSVYRVKPIGKVEPDSDWLLDSLQCERAKVLEVVVTDVPPINSVFFSLLSQIY